MYRENRSVLVASLLALVLAAGAERASAAEPAGLPPYLYDRGDGITTSLFGTYVREKEFLVYPFFEYTRFKNFEYKPSELGYTGDDDYFGTAREKEYLLFLAYGFTDSLALEFESALYSSIDFSKAPNDPSAVPSNMRESGLGDTEVNLRWRFQKETVTRPELTFFFKTVFPLQKDKKLLGTQGWEFEPGLVVTKGYSFGTLAFRISSAYDSAERKGDLIGEYAIDYVKRVSQNWRFVVSVEGEQDEVSLIGEAQYALGKNMLVKLNSGFGLTKKAPDFAPEIGVLFRF